jgi:hypothetical protein
MHFLCLKATSNIKITKSKTRKYYLFILIFQLREKVKKIKARQPRRTILVQNFVP